MSADLLRRAAETLRAHAARTAIDPAAVEWAVQSTGLHMDNTASYFLRPQPGRPSTWVGTAKCGVPEYVALMHPPVALAVAEWLERTADVVAAFAEDVAGRERPGDLTETDEAALAVARAILREE